MGDATWAGPILTALISAVAYLYRRQTESEKARADKAEKRADDLQKIINDRAIEAERIAQESIRENAGLRADLDAVKRSLDEKVRR